ncbi:hypothetical protein HGO34_02390 [Agrobacterium vitis]|uniref:Uncharacterized protein n=1 Tax=Agrobacterium vitis TaxID=373 RepID=A0AAE5ATN4_AGRVI|nr:hypothetical protein [Allorhizobium sp. Av2]MCM2438566.1 hypothetical protein [Agrobacterium vitis]MUZ56108.1 hypothetical protein [Agrobacterium vitis]MVA64754.1 hypothetical protein [Agrobacterium vitis]MVA85725.1 hypothetical protein [Agrobacterium vitis]
MKYSLSLTFDTDVLANIKAAGQTVAIAKTVGTGAPNVLWLTIDPFQSNTIEWEEDYWIYASTVNVSNGASINKLTEVTPGPALDGGYYDLNENSIFGPFRKNNSVFPVATGSYAAINNMSYEQYPSLTFGLSQTALVNQTLQERKPISAQTVLATQSVRMTPFTEVYLWLQSEYKSQTIITEISGTTSVAQFGGSITDIALKYDPIHGLFGHA